MASSACRAWCFTHNNYPNTLLEDAVECKYIVYGKEVGASGTPHLQGFIYFTNAKKATAVHKLLPGCHIEICRSVIASIAYCKKEGDWKERGDPPMTQKEKGDAGAEVYKQYREAAERGEFEVIPEKIRFLRPELLQRHHKNGMLKRALEDTETQHLWYFGPPGTGKSRKARTDHPEAYLKMANKWWDGYAMEETVLLEDFDKRHEVLVYHLKIWADRYPFLAEIKGSAMKIRPQLLIVTSNYHPRDIWTDAADLEPILRRFKTVEFKTLTNGP